MSDIRFNCNDCGQSLEVEMAGAGLEIECPTCGSQLIIPASEPRTQLSIENVTDSSPPVPPAQLPSEPAQPPPQPECSEEIKQLLKSAEHGDAKSQGQLGFAYWNGQGVPQNYIEAIQWLAKALENGFGDEPYWGLEAQSYLGRAYFEDLGVEQNYLQAIKWFAIAAEQGHALAQTHYCSACRQGGIAYWTGNRGVPQNDSEAVKLFSWAADVGDGEAQTYLGIAYIEGRGVPQSDREAVKWFSKAANQGDDMAQFWLGKCYFSGRGVSQNYVEAYKWASLAAAQGGIDPQKFHAELSANLSPKQIVEGERLAGVQLAKQVSSDGEVESRQSRQAIPSEVRREVWRRDEGMCVRCGSREKLEYDHIIPISKGGSNTVRNIELLCENCNRSKSGSIQ